MKLIEFVECPTCHAKPGMAALCASCLSNRSAISTLKDELVKANEKIRRANVVLEAVQVILR